jgi:hypothetical protein
MRFPQHILKIIKPLKNIASAYHVRIYFGKCSRRYSFSQPHHDYIYLNLMALNGKYCSLNQIYSIFFHELAHIIVYRAGKFPLANQPCYKTEEEKTKYRKIVIHFEKYVDRQGYHLMNEWFPLLRYEKNYKTKEHFRILLKQASELVVEAG